jgi:hypothetical protein
MHFHTWPLKEQVLGMGRINTKLGNELTDEHKQRELKDTGFEVSTRCKGRSSSSGLLHNVVFRLYTNAPEEHTPPIFWAEMLRGRISKIRQRGL